MKEPLKEDVKAKPANVVSMSYYGVTLVLNEKVSEGEEQERYKSYIDSCTALGFEIVEWCAEPFQTQQKAKNHIHAVALAPKGFRYTRLKKLNPKIHIDVFKISSFQELHLWTRYINKTNSTGCAEDEYCFV